MFFYIYLCKNVLTYPHLYETTCGPTDWGIKPTTLFMLQPPPDPQLKKKKKKKIMKPQICLTGI